MKILPWIWYLYAVTPNLMAVGGGARSRFWLETLATVLQVPLDVPKGSEFGAAMGAARLAVCAANGTAPSDVMTPPDIEECIEPRRDLIAPYESEYERYRQFYKALAPLAASNV